MELLERAPQLAELEGLLGGLAGGGGRLVFLGGEAGVGKTALVEAFCRGVRPPIRVLRGGCDPLSTPRPLGPLADVSREIGGDLARLVREQSTRDAIFRTLLDGLGGPRPALLIFEDVHWADEATLDLLRYLGRRIGATQALLVATYRDDEVGPRHPLRVVLGDLATASAVHRMSLRPLSERSVRDLASGSDIDAAALYRQTGGNPFFVTEVLAASAVGIPPTVRDAVLARAARLAAAGRAVLDAAAVIGAVVEPSLLEAVIGPHPASVEACLVSGMLRVADDRYAFRHEIGRETVLQALDPGRRQALHGSVLAALRAGVVGEAPLARLAHHAEEAGDVPAILAYAPAAARQASDMRAHRQAAEQYERALRFAGSLAPVERAELLEAFSVEADVIDHLDEGIEARREAARIWREVGNGLREGENLCELSRLLIGAGQNASGEEAIRAGLELLEALPPDHRLARAYHIQAGTRMLNRDNAEAIEIGRRAIELGEQFGAARAVIGGYSTIGAAMLVSGDERGIEPLERSMRLAEAEGLDNAVANAYGNLGSACGEIYLFAAADHYLANGIAYALERDLDSSRLYMLSWQALSHLYQGRWSAAAEVAASVLQTPHVAAISRIMALIALGRIRVRRGDPDIRAALDEALALARQADTLQRLAPAHAALAEAAWQAGDRAETAAQAGEVYDLALKHRHAWHSGELTYWLRLAGESRAVPTWTAEPWRLQLAGDWRGAAAAWAERLCPYEQARALADGDEPALREALAIFERLGAAPMVAVVSRRLRERGARAIPRGPRPSTRANPAGLTRRELEVLALLAEGQRNAEIAEHLYLAPKTVERHVSAILAKLDAATRTEAVRRAGELGIGDVGRGTRGG